MTVEVREAVRVSPMSKRKRQWGRWQAQEKHFDEGGQASVYYVTDALGIHSGLYVLKQLKNAKRKERFHREIDLLRQLAPSEHIVEIIDSSSPADLGKPWYVMPRADGTLNDALSRVQSNIDESVRLFQHVCPRRPSPPFCGLHPQGSQA